MVSILLKPLSYTLTLVIDDIKEHAVERPKTLLIVLSTALLMFMFTYNIYSLADLVDWIYANIFWIWSEFVRIIGQFIVDLFFAIFQFMGLFVVGIVEGIGDMWKNFKVPPIKVRELNIKKI